MTPPKIQRRYFVQFYEDLAQILVAIKKMRSMFIKGCVIDKERHRIVVVDDNDIAKDHGNNSESFVFDTRKVAIPRKKVLPGNETSTKTKDGIETGKKAIKTAKSNCHQNI